MPRALPSPIWWSSSVEPRGSRAKGSQASRVGAKRRASSWQSSLPTHSADGPGQAQVALLGEGQEVRQEVDGGGVDVGPFVELQGVGDLAHGVGLVEDAPDELLRLHVPLEGRIAAALLLEVGPGAALGATGASAFGRTMRRSTLHCVPQEAQVRISWARSPSNSSPQPGQVTVSGRLSPKAAASQRVSWLPAFARAQLGEVHVGVLFPQAPLDARLGPAEAARHEALRVLELERGAAGRAEAALGARENAG